MESSVSRRPARTLRRAVAVTATAALALTGSFLGATAASAAPEPGTISNATFSWGLSGESGAGSYVGGCNFLSAGTAGDTGSSRVWTESDGFWKASEGNVTITKPGATGTEAATWANKCLTADGTAASPQSVTSLTGNVVNIDRGTGTVAADGSTEINWTGAFTVAFYGGMTYWTAANPTLTIDAEGDGQVTATVTGYASTRSGTTSTWTPISAREIVLADFDGSAADSDSLTVTPDYLGVSITTTGTAQNKTGNVWGAFPQSFIDFQTLTGQSSFWYSSGTSRDAAKAALPFSVNYSLTGAPVVETPVADEQELEVTVPERAPAAGFFGWSFEGTEAVNFGTAVETGSTFTAAGNLNTIVVTDTRTGGTAPYNWSISGQASAFSSGSGSFSSGYLGWTPAVSGAGSGVTAGSAVTSTVLGGTGLTSSATLATSNAASSASIDAGLSLVIPNSTPAGNYTSTLTVTALG